MTDWPARLLDAVNEITGPRRVELHGRSMLGQLQLDVDQDEDSSPKTAGGGGAGGFESRPPGHYAPRELLSSMEHEVRIWADWLGLDDRGDLVANLGQVLGIAQRLNDEGWQNELGELTRDVEKIGGALRRYCGLERIFRPRTTCPDPDCGKTGTVTVWLDQAGQRAERARCHHCGRTWDSSQVGLLIEHIRAETDRPRQSTLSGYQRLSSSIARPDTAA